VFFFCIMSKFLVDDRCGTNPFCCPEFKCITASTKKYKSFQKFDTFFDHMKKEHRDIFNGVEGFASFDKNSDAAAKTAVAEKVYEFWHNNKSTAAPSAQSTPVRTSARVAANADADWSDMDEDSESSAASTRGLVSALTGMLHELKLVERLKQYEIRDKDGKLIGYAKTDDLSEATFKKINA